MIIAISTAVPLLLAGLLVQWAAYRAARGTLPLNFRIGIRTSATLRSEDAWRTGHAAAAIPISVGGVGLIVAAAAALFLGEQAIVAAMFGCAWIVVWLIVASTVAGKAAATVGEDPARS
ncbi:MAG: hypothetical protein BGO45_09780 [Microbacterium sp. 71-36]|uniref:SdpI family protein n=1 Tax=unclassified Microbacterium TaxID=2609290 RepID=UPI00086D2677|nr:MULTISPECIES: SdpI family protein [unclassified Microbacterium]MBN9212793.1 SdpI family protein [Microbacterium sp.]ODT39089.1 MAG: hypothetical protein ABS60_07875 [Microbacterium sp. SCN 71-17]ODU50562.1 MAG: hypothetical protein ABT07_03300 [Microbacterium sp. SCN 70-10]OJV77095.1 MAG: hypothetical protein BGO45_09780 [Microbacterium sp. 71-36]